MSKKMKCFRCGKLLENVGDKATKVKCDCCVNKELNEALKNQSEESLITK